MLKEHILETEEWFIPQIRRKLNLMKCHGGPRQQ